MTTKTGWKWNLPQLLGLLTALAVYAAGHVGIFPDAWQPYVVPASDAVALLVAFLTHSPRPAQIAKTAVVLALMLTLGGATGCGGGSAPTITHATIVRALKWACAAVQALPDETPAPTSGGEATP